MTTSDVIDMNNGRRTMSDENYGVASELMISIIWVL